MVAKKLLFEETFLVRFRQAGGLVDRPFFED